MCFVKVRKILTTAWIDCRGLLFLIFSLYTLYLLP
uniref:Uncharacterized protein n=1 Tax=Anguilla anguilla TaxID=7936 RepID=A0A0E9P916_ANGAN